MDVKNLFLLLALINLFGCLEKSIKNDKYLVFGTIVGLEGSVSLSNKQDTLTVYQNGYFEFSQLLSLLDSYQVRIDESPDGQVCSIKNSFGNYESLFQKKIRIKCVPSTMVLDDSKTKGLKNKKIQISLDSLPNERLNDLLFRDLDVLGFHGDSIESISTVAGIFIKDSGINAYYGVTRSGEYLRLFRFNLVNGKVDLVRELKDAKGSWSIKRDGEHIYIGTYNPALIYRFNLFSNEMELLAEITGENYIWDMTFSNELLFIGTYPSAKLFSLNTATNELIDYGKMSSRTESKYIRSLASYRDIVYAGLGTSAELIEYDVLTNVKKSIPLPTDKSESFVYQLKVDSNFLFVGLSPSTEVLVYDLITNQFIYHLNDIRVQPLYLPTFDEDNIQLSMRGFMLEYDKNRNTLVRVSNDFGVATHFVNNKDIAAVNENGLYFESSYQGLKKLEVDFLSNGLAGIRAAPYSIIGHDCKVFIGERRLKVLNLESGESSLNLIHGEPKVMSVLNGQLFTANYSGAQVWRYPLSLFDDGLSRNLSFSNFLYSAIAENQNRPLAIDSHNGHLIIGTEPNYGTYGGAFTIITPRLSEQTTIVNIVNKHSISAVAFDTDEAGVVYIGTSDSGGTGSDRLNESAFLIKWNFFNQSEEFRFKFNPDIHEIIKIIVIDQSNTLVILTKGGVVFSIDKNNTKVRNKSSQLFTDIILSNDGFLYGIDATSIHVIDPSNLSSEVLVSGFNSLRLLVEDPITSSMLFIDDNFLHSLFFSTKLCEH